MVSEWALRRAGEIIGGSFVEHDELCGRLDAQADGRTRAEIHAAAMRHREKCGDKVTSDE